MLTRAALRLLAALAGLGACAPVSPASPGNDRASPAPASSDEPTAAWASATVTLAEPALAPDEEDAPSAPPAPFVCAPPEHGLGAYRPYVALSPRGRLLVPVLAAPPEDGAYDVLLHFHFHDAVRRVFVEVAHPMALVGIDLGEGSKGYADAFSEPGAYRALRAAIEAGLRAETGDSRAHIGKLVLSSWSAGFAASVKILAQAPEDVSGAIFLDSLYAPADKDEHGELRRGSVFAPALRPVVALARRAVAGRAFLFLTYSHAATHGYASTEDVARYLATKLGLAETRVPPGEDPRGLLGRVDVGGLHLRGFGGADGRAHCGHLGRIRDALAALREATSLDAARPGVRSPRRDAP